MMRSFALPPSAWVLLLLTVPACTGKTRVDASVDAGGGGQSGDAATASGGSAGAPSGGSAGSSGQGGVSGASGSAGSGTGGADPAGQEPGPDIVLDQFGYRPSAEKIAVIRDPEQGFDAERSFTPGGTYVLVDASNEQQVFSAAPVSWKSGALDPSSGDRAYWFDFTSVTGPGTYYVLDVEKNVRSENFRIAENVYHEVLRHAVRTFFYQRAGFAKEAPYAESAWVDGASHVGALQDKNCRLYSAPNDASTERDLHGGWYDAGDYNKYTNWSASYVIQLMRSYDQSPTSFGDDSGIPESGNGIPDIVDEAKWGIDWHVRMQNQNGSVLSIVGLAGGSPPSAATARSLYGSASTSATLSTAAAFAYASKRLRAFPSLVSYADDLVIRAENAWSWAIANPSVIFRNNSAADGTAGLGAGQQEVGNRGRAQKRLSAAVHLFAVTGKTAYRDYVDANYTSINPVSNGYAGPWDVEQHEILLDYAALPDATPAVATAIKQAFRSAMNGTDALGGFRADTDPYLARIPTYTWGSNATKSNQGNMFYNLIAYDIDSEVNAEALRAAERYVHYLHGLNPLGLAYVSNMKSNGADRSANELYHTWFAHGSKLWDRVGVSTYGPPPGFLTGGPNPSYNWDGCCPSSCGSPQNNALCVSEPIEPPRNQPPQKSYKDFNTSWPLNSWEISENSCGYQVAYIRLLSKFAKR